MLIQIDGSYHRWLGRDGPEFTLLLAVDDATGMVAHAAFCEYENTRDYLLLMRGIIECHGIPIAIYTDRHSVFKHVTGTGHSEAPTQFSRAMDELGIQMIFALSPQAKGRVERMAGTFYDRLVTELRLVGATTIEEANVVLKDFVVRFNRRFGAPAHESDVAYRPIDSEMCMDSVLCFKHRRWVARDNTVRYRWRTLQLLPGKDRPSHAGVEVDVLEGLNGQLSVQHNRRVIPTQEAPPHPGILRHFNGRSPNQDVPYLNSNGIGRRWAEVLASLDRERERAAGAATTVQPPMASPGRPGTSPAHGGSPRLFRLPGGRRYRRRSEGGCPSAVSRGH